MSRTAHELPYFLLLWNKERVALKAEFARSIFSELRIRSEASTLGLFLDHDVSHFHFVKHDFNIETIFQSR